MEKELSWSWKRSKTWRRRRRTSTLARRLQAAEIFQGFRVCLFLLFSCILALVSPGNFGCTFAGVDIHEGCVIFGHLWTILGLYFIYGTYTTKAAKISVENGCCIVLFVHIFNSVFPSNFRVAKCGINPMIIMWIYGVIRIFLDCI